MPEELTTLGALFGQQGSPPPTTTVGQLSAPDYPSDSLTTIGQLLSQTSSSPDQILDDALRYGGRAINSTVNAYGTAANQDYWRQLGQHVGQVAGQAAFQSAPPKPVPFATPNAVAPGYDAPPQPVPQLDLRQQLEAQQARNQLYNASANVAVGQVGDAAQQASSAVQSVAALGGDPYRTEAARAIFGDRPLTDAENASLDTRYLHEPAYWQGLRDSGAIPRNYVDPIQREQQRKQIHAQDDQAVMDAAIRVAKATGDSSIIERARLSNLIRSSGGKVPDGYMVVPLGLEKPPEHGEWSEYQQRYLPLEPGQKEANDLLMQSRHRNTALTPQSLLRGLFPQLQLNQRQAIQADPGKWAAGSGPDVYDLGNGTALVNKSALRSQDYRNSVNPAELPTTPESYSIGGDINRAAMDVEGTAKETIGGLSSMAGNLTQRDASKESIGNWSDRVRLQARLEQAGASPEEARAIASGQVPPNQNALQSFGQAAMKQGAGEVREANDNPDMRSWLGTTAAGLVNSLAVPLATGPLAPVTAGVMGAGRQYANVYQQLIAQGVPEADAARQATMAAAQSGLIEGAGWAVVPKALGKVPGLGGPATSMAQLVGKGAASGAGFAAATGIPQKATEAAYVGKPIDWSTLPAEMGTAAIIGGLMHAVSGYGGMKQEQAVRAFMADHGIAPAGRGFAERMVNLAQNADRVTEDDVAQAFQQAAATGQPATVGKTDLQVHPEDAGAAAFLARQKTPQLPAPVPEAKGLPNVAEPTTTEPGRVPAPEGTPGGPQEATGTPRNGTVVSDTAPDGAVQGRSTHSAPEENHSERSLESTQDLSREVGGHALAGTVSHQQGDMIHFEVGAGGGQVPAKFRAQVVDRIVNSGVTAQGLADSVISKHGGATLYGYTIPTAEQFQGMSRADKARHVEAINEMATPDGVYYKSGREIRIARGASAEVLRHEVAHGLAGDLDIKDRNALISWAERWGERPYMTEENIVNALAKGETLQGNDSIPRGRDIFETLRSKLDRRAMRTMAPGHTGQRQPINPSFDRHDPAAVAQAIVDSGGTPEQAAQTVAKLQEQASSQNQARGSNDFDVINNPLPSGASVPMFERVAGGTQSNKIGNGIAATTDVMHDQPKWVGESALLAGKFPSTADGIYEALRDITVGAVPPETIGDASAKATTKTSLSTRELRSASDDLAAQYARIPLNAREGAIVLMPAKWVTGKDFPAGFAFHFASGKLVPTGFRATNLPLSSPYILPSELLFASRASVHEYLSSVPLLGGNYYAIENRERQGNNLSQRPGTGQGRPPAAAGGGDRVEAGGEKQPIQVSLSRVPPPNDQGLPEWESLAKGQARRFGLDLFDQKTRQDVKIWGSTFEEAKQEAFRRGLLDPNEMVDPQIHYIYEMKDGRVEHFHDLVNDAFDFPRIDPNEESPMTKAFRTGGAIGAGGEVVGGSQSNPNVIPGEVVRAKSLPAPPPPVETAGIIPQTGERNALPLEEGQKGRPKVLSPGEAGGAPNAPPVPPTPLRAPKSDPQPLPPLHEDISPGHVQHAWDKASARYPKIAQGVKSIKPLPYTGPKQNTASYNPETGVLRVNPDKPLSVSSLMHEFTHVAQGLRGKETNPSAFNTVEEFDKAVEAPARARGLAVQAADANVGSVTTPEGAGRATPPSEAPQRPGGKEPWEMTKADFLAAVRAGQFPDITSEDQAINHHIGSVASAVAKGKTISPEVQADYKGKIVFGKPAVQASAPTGKEAKGLKGALSAFEDGAITDAEFSRRVLSLAGNKNDPGLSEATAKFRQEQEYDRQLKGRNDMEEATAHLAAAVRAYLSGKRAAPIEAAKGADVLPPTGKASSVEEMADKWMAAQQPAGASPPSTVEDVASKIMDTMSAGDAVQSIRDLGDAVGVKPGPNEKPLNSLLNRALVKLVNDGKIVQAGGDWGEPKFRQVKPVEATPTPIPSIPELQAQRTKVKNLEKKLEKMTTGKGAGWLPPPIRAETATYLSQQREKLTEMEAAFRSRPGVAPPEASATEPITAAQRYELAERTARSFLDPSRHITSPGQAREVAKTVWFNDDVIRLAFPTEGFTEGWKIFGDAVRKAFVDQQPKAEPPHEQPTQEAPAAQVERPAGDVPVRAAGAGEAGEPAGDGGESKYVQELRVSDVSGPPAELPLVSDLNASDPVDAARIVQSYQDHVRQANEHTRSLNTSSMVAVNAAYRTLLKPVEGGPADTQLQALPGKEKEVQAIGTQMEKEAKKKWRPPKFDKTFTTAKASALPGRVEDDGDRALSIMSHAAKEMTRYAINSIGVVKGRIAATDGKRMIVIEGPKPFAAKDGLYTADKSGKLSPTPNTQEAKFPPIDDVMPKLGDNPNLVKNIAIDGTVRRLRQIEAMAPGKDSGSVNNPILVYVNPNRTLGFATHHPEHGYAQVGVSYEGARPAFAVNAQYLRQSLEAMYANHADVVDIGFSAPNRPINIYGSAQGYKMQAVVMPLTMEQSARNMKEALGIGIIDSLGKHIERLNQYLAENKHQASVEVSPVGDIIGKYQYSDFTQEIPLKWNDRMGELEYDAATAVGKGVTRGQADEWNGLYRKFQKWDENQPIAPQEQKPARQRKAKATPPPANPAFPEPDPSAEAVGRALAEDDTALSASIKSKEERNKEQWVKNLTKLEAEARARGDTVAADNFARELERDTGIKTVEPVAKPAGPHLAEMPLKDFAAAVQKIADAHPVGWGDNKVFIHHAYAEAAKLDPTLTMRQFKTRLVDAAREGLVKLSRADLVGEMHPHDVRASETYRMGDPEVAAQDANPAESHFIMAKPADRQRIREAPTGEEAKAISREDAARVRAEINRRDQRSGHVAFWPQEGSPVDLLGKWAVHGLREISGKMFPRTMSVSRLANEAMARHISSPIYTAEAGPVLAEQIIGPPQHKFPLAQVVTREFYSKKYNMIAGAALAEDNLRSIKQEYLDAGDQAGAADVFTFIGAKNSPFKTEQEYQDALVHPRVQEIFERYGDWQSGEPEENYKIAQGIAPSEDLPTRGLQTGLRVNLIALRGDEPASSTAVGSIRRGDPRNPLKRRSPFAIQATGHGQAYEGSLAAMIQNTMSKGDSVATLHKMYQTLVKEGLAKYGERMPEFPGEIQADPRPIDVRRGRTVLPGVTAPETHSIVQRLWVRSDVYPEVRKALDVDDPQLRNTFVRGAARVFNEAALAGLTDAVSHVANTISALYTSSGTGTIIVPIIKKMFGRMVHDPEIQLRFVELARIGSIPQAHPPLAKYNPLRVLAWIAKAMNAFTSAGRLVLDDAFTNLAKKGVWQDTAANRRDYVNQTGQYNRRAQHWLVQMLRDTGIGPFATAATNFLSLGIRKTYGASPGATATNYAAAAKMRGLVMARIAGVFALAALVKYLFWRDDKKGNDQVPYGAVRVPNNDKGEVRYLDIADILGLKRGLRAFGIDAAMKASAAGKKPGDVASDAWSQAWRSLTAPARGPLVDAAAIAATGKSSSGYQVAPAVPIGENPVPGQIGAALKHANPIVRSFTSDKGIVEGLEQQLGKFTPKTVGEERSAAEIAAHQHYVEDIPDIHRTAEQQKRYDQRKQIEQSLQGRPEKEAADEIRKMIRSGQIDAATGKLVLRKVTDTNLENWTKHIPIGDGMEVFRTPSITPDEQRQMAHVLRDRLEANKILPMVQKRQWLDEINRAVPMKKAG